MNKIPRNETIDKLPVVEIQATLHAFIEPVLEQMPDMRLQIDGGNDMGLLIGLDVGTTDAKRF